ncbi:hypothetical protein PspLS_01032 [Pyricularia sp. CBS 133598]|nr:hypothetical protein PspLS_01032 [Pyricularia sp. CBS 133598]
MTWHEVNCYAWERLRGLYICNTLELLSVEVFSEYTYGSIRDYLRRWIQDPKVGQQLSTFVNQKKLQDFRGDPPSPKSLWSVVSAN